ncbi:FimV/HubP family polar landmark protein [Piscinibacter koreensis]|uniref:FimV/HubP family polar landmark protein n=1 Tax=Piscinibacter koreensis TaxID=2742824 RepID=UPI001FE49729|nr:FimV/HubP family polar landmark protein [Schlegelella koreensis]
MKRNTKSAGRLALTAIAAATLSLASPLASALGLGRLSVQSALGEALRAEIEITSISAEESANLRIRVAPPEAYRAAGVEYNPVLPGTQAVLQRRGDGRMFVRLMSDRGVQEPFVDVILEISWATGRLVREYTLLFDPPANVARAQPAPAPTPPAFAPLPREAAPVARPLPPVARDTEDPARTAAREAAREAARAARDARAAERAAQRAAAPVDAPTRAAAPTAPAAGAGDAVRVRPGDSLSRIASRTLPSGVSLEQMLAALYRANPQAFINDNINRLKAGAVLTVPSAADAQGIPPSQARQIITAQSADFGTYRQRLAGSTPATPPADSPRQSGGSVQASIDDRRQGAAPSPDRLTLSKGGAPARSAEEERISKERELAEAQRRVNELTRAINDLRGGAAGSAATPPTTTAAAPTAPATIPAAPGSVTPGATGSATAVPPASTGTATPAPGATTATPGTTATAPALPGVAGPASAVAPLPPLAGAASAASAPGSVVATAPAASAASAARAGSAPAGVARAPVTAPTPAAEEPSLLGSLFQDNPLVLGLGAVVLLLAGYGAYRYAKRPKKETSETSFLESRLQPDSFFGASGGQRIDTRESGASSSSMTYSLSQLDAIGDVDPVAEADVYLAYGRDLQAEEILKEAMRSTPDRLAIRTKLLEVYAKRRDTKGFEVLATQLYGLTHGQGEDWARAQELGAQIDPENPLYQAGGAPSHGDSRDADAGPPTEPLGASTLPQSFDSMPASFAPTSISSVPATDSMFATVDFDLDDPNAGSPSQTMPLEPTLPPASAPATAASSDAFAPSTLKMPLAGGAPRPAGPDLRNEPLNFDLSGFTLDLDKPADAPAPSAAPATDDDALGLPFVDDGSGPDPLARKLELAEEFQRIGDHDGARELLREVLTTATGGTKAKAQRMLDSLG